MYTFPDKKGRTLALRPEGTATLQKLASQLPNDTKLFYIARCYRYERPQKGRYREFTQFGIEILNPTQDYSAELQELATRMITQFIPQNEFELDSAAQRGLAYYSGDGFEIRSPSLGAQQQILGGGPYAEGIGFAIGIDRLMLAINYRPQEVDYDTDGRSIAGRLTKKRKLGGIIFAEISALKPVSVLIEKTNPGFNALKNAPIGSIIAAQGIPEKSGKNIKLSQIQILATPTQEMPALIQRLASAEIKSNLQKRAALIRALRREAHANEFIEYETPILAAPTKEGAALFEVKGTEFALPQSPQLYKQLLMIAGYEKYFQVARCFRNEGNRANRQPEFTQFCLEQSFTTDQELMELGEKLIHAAMAEIGIELPPFIRLTYAEAIAKYGTAEPNLGNQGFIITRIPMFEKATTGKKAMHHPFTAHEHGTAQSFEFILQGQEIGGGSMRPHTYKSQLAILQELGYTEAQAEQEFAIILEPLKAAAPPHGGFALGIERLLATAHGGSEITPFIAFPKTGAGKGIEN